MDPRLKGIELKMKDVGRIIPVVSGKGGVGKSLISTTTALLLSEKGHRVGLLDLDFHGASDHLILGVKPREIPGEDKGVIPPLVHRVKFMSIVYYTQNHPLPMRGSEISDALIEIMAITRWDTLDFLIIDMPPGLGEQLLDLLRFIPRGEFLVVTTPSPLSLNVVGKLLSLLKEGNKRIVGLIENMSNDKNKGYTKHPYEKMQVSYIGEISMDDNIDNAIGNVKKILSTKFTRELREIIEKIEISEARPQ